MVCPTLGEEEAGVTGVGVAGPAGGDAAAFAGSGDTVFDLAAAAEARGARSVILWLRTGESRAGSAGVAVRGASTTPASVRLASHSLYTLEVRSLIILCRSRAFSQMSLSRMLKRLAFVQISSRSCFRSVQVGYSFCLTLVRTSDSAMGRRITT